MAVNEKFFKIIKQLSTKSKSISLFVQKKLVQFFEGLTALPEDFRNYLHQIWLDIFPETTRELEMWKDQFGIEYFPDDDEDQIDVITAEWQSMGGQSAYYLQSELQKAGFGVQVHENNPPVDPDTFLSSQFVMIANGPNAYAGRSDAFAGRTGGELLVNGPILTNYPLYLSYAGNENCVCGNTVGHCGYFAKIVGYDKTYEVTDDPDYWGSFFFIGGDATRDPITNELTDIANANVSNSRKDEFKRLILKLKPSQTWAGLLINYV